MIWAQLQKVPSYPSTLAHGIGLGALCQELAPAHVQVTHCAGNALPFRVEWRSARGPVMFYGLTPDAAASEAVHALRRGSVERPAAPAALTDPAGDSAWAEAMRDYIAELDERRAERKRPNLRIV